MLTPIQEKLGEDSEQNAASVTPLKKHNKSVEKELLDLDGINSDESNSNNEASLAISELAQLVSSDIQENSEE